LRRTGKGEMPLVELLRFDSGRLEIDSVRHEVRVAGEPVELTPSEYKLLVALRSIPAVRTPGLS
jgi:DNA-binding response OmpR family regulator